MLLALLLLALVYIAVPLLCHQDSAVTLTDITGTRSSDMVTAGLMYANPSNKSFGYPKTTDVGFSFTADGYVCYTVSIRMVQLYIATGTLDWIHGE
ncbi:hypothetical protein PILCRDRAFT_710855 [Piloderma croceum F 1598]|uniref:Uncharacterized protein n=1 Tax=Piloderma croceum (strain F 1598) TaxID=765440 RepID=A0A0C3F286_PILCF|nr:hypothetical protein PILCRDRAFT_710855 [Piloderma croceum F 1598]